MSSKKRAASPIPGRSSKRSNRGKRPSGRTIPIHPTLTFGVEFEFLLATVSDPSKDLGCPDGKPRTFHFPTSSLENYGEIYAQAVEDKEAESVETWGAAAEHIANTLRAAGIPAFPFWRRKHRLCDKTKLNKFRASDEDLNGWLVEYDESVDTAHDLDNFPEFWKPYEHPREKYPYRDLGMEISSPVPPMEAQFDEQGHIHDSNSFATVERVAELLKEKYNVFVNPTAGFHVHVGDHHRGFPIPVVQKLMAFIWAFEPSILTAHPANRHGPSNGGSIHCLPLRYGVRPISHEAINLSPSRGSHFMDIIYTILKSDGFEDIQHIKELLSPHESHMDRSDMYQSAYKLGHLENEGPKKTIEFRQHTGTLDGERATRWAMFCVLLVKFCAEDGCGRFDWDFGGGDEEAE